jgi:iron complex transport system substrate-binding protein
VELKSVEVMLPVHRKQVLTYLRAKDVKLGLLINFGAPLLKDGFERIANGL